MRAWNIIFLIGAVIYITIRGVFERRTRGGEKLIRRVDALEKILLVIVFIGSLIPMLLYIFTPWLSFADYRLPWWVPWIGLGVMMAALWLFWRSHADLGRNWSITLEIKKDHELIRRGVYRHIRHPMYASIWLFSLSQALMLSNWLAGWSALAAFAPLYFIRTPREEKLMLEHFGEQYREYMNQTGRIVPWRMLGSRVKEEEGVMR